MHLRTLGTQGLKVSAIGLGTMGMTAFYGDYDRGAAEESNLEAIGKALEIGVNFLDTAWIYQSFGLGGGNHYNEELVGKALKRFGREKFVVATKFGIGVENGQKVISGKPDFIKKQLSESLTRLGTDYIDLYYMHRMDPTTPIEETVTFLKQLVEAGTIKYIGLSECSPTELRRANAIHPVSAIQMEWSLQTRDLEATIIPVARELGVGIVAYSPLGRGLLTGALTSVDNLAATDWRRTNPRFAAENIEKNVATSFFALAAKYKATPAQLALAWVLARGDDVVPIPGTTKTQRIIENAGAADIKLTVEEWAEVETSVPPPSGERYDEASMAATFSQRL